MAMLACIGTAQAQQISVEDAQTIAQQWLTRGEKNARVKQSAQPVRLAHTMKSTADDATNLYVFNRTGDGFVIIAGDERVGSQILGFSDEGEFNPDYMPDALRDLMCEYNEQIDIIKQNEPEVSHNGRGPKQATSSQIKYPQFHDVTDVHGPLLTTFWVQDAPYNWEVARRIAGVQNPEGMTEAELDAKKVPPTGCVITALSQIMNYHKWPEVGTGSFSYKEYRGIHSDPTNGTDISSNFADHTYDWSHMRIAYEGAYDEDAADGTKDKYNKVEGNAVAQLMYDVGVSLRTRYGHNATNNNGKSSFSGTGGCEYEITNALVNYFGYASTLTARARGNKGSNTSDSQNNYTDEEWEAMLVNEIDNKRPVFMCGANNGNTESHAYVCDGYAYGKSDNKLYFHVNWGWGQYGTGSEAGDEKHLYMYNGYFRSTAFTYHSCYYPEGDKNYKVYEYAYKQYAIIGIQPDKGDYWGDWTTKDYANYNYGYAYNSTAPGEKEVFVQKRTSKDGCYTDILVKNWGMGTDFNQYGGYDAHFIINNATNEVTVNPFDTGKRYNSSYSFIASTPENSAEYNSDKLQKSGLGSKFHSSYDPTTNKLTLNLAYTVSYYYDYTTQKKSWTSVLYGTSDNYTYTDVLTLPSNSYELNVSDANLATLYLGYNAQLPSGVTAYYVTDAGNSSVKLVKITDEVIRNNTGVIIQAEKGNYTFDETSTAADKLSGNLLNGTTTEKTFSLYELNYPGSPGNQDGYKVYFLQVRDYSPAFVPAKLNGTDAEMTIAAHKAWLEYPTSSASGTPNQLTIDGFTTDIQRLIDDADMGSAKRYNLAGQQVGNDYHGIVIVNGKKYLR